MKPGRSAPARGPTPASRRAEELVRVVARERAASPPPTTAIARRRRAGRAARHRQRRARVAAVTARVRVDPAQRRAHVARRRVHRAQRRHPARVRDRERGPPVDRGGVRAEVFLQTVVDRKADEAARRPEVARRFLVGVLAAHKGPAVDRHDDGPPARHGVVRGDVRVEQHALLGARARVRLVGAVDERRGVRHVGRHVDREGRPAVDAGELGAHDRREGEHAHAQHFR